MLGTYSNYIYIGSLPTSTLNFSKGFAMTENFFQAVKELSRLKLHESEYEQIAQVRGGLTVPSGRYPPCDG